MQETHDGIDEIRRQPQAGARKTSPASAPVAEASVEGLSKELPPMPGEILKGFGPPAACRIAPLAGAFEPAGNPRRPDARRSAAPLAEEEPPRPGKFTRYPGAIAR